MNPRDYFVAHLTKAGFIPEVANRIVNDHCKLYGEACLWGDCYLTLSTWFDKKVLEIRSRHGYPPVDDTRDLGIENLVNVCIELGLRPKLADQLVISGLITSFTSLKTHLMLVFLKSGYDGATDRVIKSIDNPKVETPPPNKN